jgi:hypothetical protein
MNISLRAQVAARSWAELESLANTRKSPIGWEPFFNSLLSAGNPKLASLFIPKCTNLTYKERIEMWVKCGMVKQAAEEAVKNKDLPALTELKGKATRPGEGAEIERMMVGLKR